MDTINSDVIVLLTLTSLFLIVTILMHSGEGAGCPTCSGHERPIRRAALERTLDRITVVTGINFGVCNPWIAWQ